MSRTLSSTLKAQIFSQAMDDPIIVLITISHSDLSEDINISSDPTEILSNGSLGTTSNGTEFVHIPFELSLQEQTDNLLARAMLKIDNISREIILAIRTATNDPPIVRIRMVLASDPNTVEIDINNLRLNNIKANAFVVEGELQPKIIQGEKYPGNTINQADFPGVFGQPTSAS